MARYVFFSFFQSWCPRIQESAASVSKIRAVVGWEWYASCHSRAPLALRIIDQAIGCRFAPAVSRSNGAGLQTVLPWSFALPAVRCSQTPGCRMLMFPGKLGLLGALAGCWASRTPYHVPPPSLTPAISSPTGKSVGVWRHYPAHHPGPAPSSTAGQGPYPQVIRIACCTLHAT